MAAPLWAAAVGAWMAGVLGSVVGGVATAFSNVGLGFFTKLVGIPMRVMVAFGFVFFLLMTLLTFVGVPLSTFVFNFNWIPVPWARDLLAYMFWVCAADIVLPFYLLLVPVRAIASWVSVRV